MRHPNTPYTETARADGLAVELGEARRVMRNLKACLPYRDEEWWLFHDVMGVTNTNLLRANVEAARAFLDRPQGARVEALAHIVRFAGTIAGHWIDAPDDVVFYGVEYKPGEEAKLTLGDLRALAGEVQP